MSVNSKVVRFPKRPVRRTGRDDALADFGAWLVEMKQEIRDLRKRVADLEADLAASKQGERNG